MRFTSSTSSQTLGALDIKTVQDFGSMLVVCNAKMNSCEFSYVSPAA